MARKYTPQEKAVFLKVMNLAKTRPLFSHPADETFDVIMGIGNNIRGSHDVIKEYIEDSGIEDMDFGYDCFRLYDNAREKLMGLRK